jgi:hypothetical protein
MARRMRKLIGLRLGDPAFSLIEELAIADDRPVTQMARRLLLERLAEIAIERQQQPGAITAAATTGAAGAAA